MSRFAQGTYQPRNPEKYIGNGLPKFRSSWESHFFRFLDEHVGVLQWASEGIRIPYIHPITGKMTSYVPDILMKYIDKDNKVIVEVIEIKPASQTSLQESQSQHDRLHAVVNQAKWAAAVIFCRQHGMKFRVVTEHELFTGRRQQAKRPRQTRKK